MKKTLTCAVALSLLPSLAMAWVADNRLTVNPLPDGSFEVIGAPGSAGSDYWCAAGDYALTVLGAQNNDRIFITRGRGEPQTSDRKSSVQFSLSLPSGEEAETGIFLSMKKVGDNLNASFARNYCYDRKNLEF